MSRLRLFLDVLQEDLNAAVRRDPAALTLVEVARRPESAGRTIVVVVASYGERYLSTVLFEDLDV